MAAIRGFDDAVHRLALPHRAEKLVAIFLGINIEAAGRYPIFDEAQQCAPGLHDIWRNAVHLDVTIVADENTLVGIKQNDTLRHVVENDGQKRTVASAGGAPVTQKPTMTAMA